MTINHPSFCFHNNFISWKEFTLKTTPRLFLSDNIFYPRSPLVTDDGAGSRVWRQLLCCCNLLELEPGLCRTDRAVSGQTRLLWSHLRPPEIRGRAIGAARSGLGGSCRVLAPKWVMVQKRMFYVSSSLRVLSNDNDAEWLSQYVIWGGQCECDTLSPIHPHIIQKFCSNIWAQP